jgi:hypothetical protein
MKKTTFYASLKRTTRDDEDNCVLSLSTDSQQLDKVTAIPAQVLLRVTIEEAE